MVLQGGWTILHAQQHLSASSPAFSAAGIFPLAILTGVWWHLTVVLTYVSLTMNGVERLFMCLLAVYKPSFMNYLSMSSAHFLIGFCFYN